MGWYYTNNLTRKQLIAENTENCNSKDTNHFIKDENGELNHYYTRTCLAHCFRGRFSGVLWTVWEINVFNKNTDILVKNYKYIGCDLFQYNKRDGWGYKPMDETMSPYFYSCPLGYLKLAGKTDSQNAQEWRKQVTEYHRDKAKSLLTF